MRIAFAALFLYPSIVVAGDLVPLVRTFDAETQQYTYFTDNSDAAEWKKTPDRYTEPTVVGYGEAAQEKGTSRLYQAHMLKKTTLFYYLKADPTLGRYLAIDKDFEFYVRTRRTTGYSPVHGVALPNGSNAFFDTDWEKVEAYAKELSRGTEKPVVNKNAFYLKDKPE